MTDLSPFQLSRVYAQGWLAGMQCVIDAPSFVIDARAEALNPGRAPVERVRWMQGFTAAMNSKLSRPGQKSPRKASSGARPSRT